MIWHLWDAIVDTVTGRWFIWRTLDFGMLSAMLMVGRARVERANQRRGYVLDGWNWWFMFGSESPYDRGNLNADGYDSAYPTAAEVEERREAYIRRNGPLSPLQRLAFWFGFEPEDKDK